MKAGILIQNRIDPL